MKTMNRTRRNALLAGILLLGANGAWAGWYDLPTTLKFDKVTVVPRDAGTATVSFDVRWENSWRHEVNHDAAWVFFKVKPAGSTEWQHLRLAADPRKGSAAGSGVLNPTGYAQKDGTPLDFLVPDDRMGVFLRRAEFGQGTVQASGLTVVADLDATFGNLKPETRNLPARRSLGEGGKPEVSAFGVEMVYIPEGPFLLGWDNNQSNSFYMCTDGDRTDVPYRVTGPGAIPTGKQKIVGGTTSVRRVALRRVYATGG